MVMPSSEYKFTPMQLKWLEALESGEYKQAVGHLEKNGSYCCLGVAASVCGVASESMHKKGDLESLPEVVESLGLKGEDGDFGDVFETDELDEDGIPLWADCLIKVNDDLHWDFKQIAQFIRENPELVFVDAAEQ
jgi:hypothetical protein